MGNYVDCCSTSCVPNDAEEDANDNLTMEARKSCTQNGSEKHRDRLQMSRLALSDCVSAPHRMRSSWKSKHRLRPSSDHHLTLELDSFSEEEDQILSTQYQLLNAQNQLFVSKHSAYFSETYNLDHRHASSMSNDSWDSASGLNAGSMSPLSTLSDNHATIILSYSDLSLPVTPSASQGTRDRSVSMPCTPRSMSVPPRAAYKCEDVESCQAVRRVIDALKVYDKVNSNSNLTLVSHKKMDHRHLLRDYQHILNDHLSQEYEINMGMEYALIRKVVQRETKVCNIRLCDGHKRYKRAKENRALSSSYKDSFVTFMDFLHCFLVHPNDL